MEEARLSRHLAFTVDSGISKPLRSEIRNIYEFGWYSTIKQ
jgi:hypothetical protein